MLDFVESLIEFAFGKGSFPALLVRAQYYLDCVESAIRKLNQCRLFYKMISTHALCRNGFFYVSISSPLPVTAESWCISFAWTQSSAPAEKDSSHRWQVQVLEYPPAATRRVFSILETGSTIAGLWAILTWVLRCRNAVPRNYRWTRQCERYMGLLG